MTINEAYLVALIATALGVKYQYFHPGSGLVYSGNVSGGPGNM